MRTILVVFCALLMMSFSIEAKKRRIPASQKSSASKQNKAMAKQLAKSRRAPKHRQSVN